jgi:hypothetical protein
MTAGFNREFHSYRWREIDKRCFPQPCRGVQIFALRSLRALRHEHPYPFRFCNDPLTHAFVPLDFGSGNANITATGCKAASDSVKLDPP